MTTLTSRTFPFLTALIAIARAAIPSATATVYDGRPVTLDPTSNAVYIGMLDLFETERNAVTAQQDWAGLSNQRRNEPFTVNCVAYSWSGEPANYAILRANVANYVGLIETAVMAQNSAVTPFGGNALWAAVSIGSINQGPSDGGSSVDAQFSVAAFARL